MKKWLFFLLIPVALFVFTAYVIIPDKFIISPVSLVKVNTRAAYRCLTEENNWKKIFGEGISEKNSTSPSSFTVNKKLPDGVEVLITGNGVSNGSIIELVQLNNDSSLVRWTTTIENNSNLFKKFEQYFAANTLKNRMKLALDSIKHFLEEEKNVYGIAVNKTTVKDTLLIATKVAFKTYPSVKDTYTLIRILENYAKTNDAKESGYPMLNIKMTDSTNFETMVALPVNKELKDHDAILHKEMVAGNILITEVKGGSYTVLKAFNSLQDYVTDHDLQSPAIPFQSLVTNRLQETDTTKWITRIYYPVY